MKRPRMLTALATGCAMTLTGCHSSWIERIDFRPTNYGSLADHHDYSWRGPQSGYRPWYHYGPANGCRDRCSVRHAAVAGANQELAEQFAGKVSSHFEFGFQQAFIDIANGGSGVLPTVPPPRYWTAPYRTSWGHDKAREWFAGYQAGADFAKCGALQEAQLTPTATAQRCDPPIAGLNTDRINVGPTSESTSAPMAPPRWNPYGANPAGSRLAPMALDGMTLRDTALPTPSTGAPASDFSTQSLVDGLPTDAEPINQPSRITALPAASSPTNSGSLSIPNDVDATATPPAASALPLTKVSIPNGVDPTTTGTTSITPPGSSPPSVGGHSISPTAPPPPAVPPPPDKIPQETVPQSTTPQPTVSPSTIPENTPPQSPILQNNVPPQKAPPPWRRLWKTGPSGTRSEGASR